jgi:hypothetical protein
MAVVLGEYSTLKTPLPVWRPAPKLKLLPEYKGFIATGFVEIG